MFRWIQTNSALLSNAASLVGTTGVTSLLGFAYWWVAARQFSPAAVGLASAAISAMTLFGTFGILGLGTLLVGELPRHKGQEAPLISTALLVVGGVGLGLGILVALIAPYVSTDLADLRADSGSVMLFAFGVSVTAVTLVLDQALIGLLQGGLQLGRNTLFAAVKLAALFLAGFWLSQTTGLTIYATWMIGNITSLLVLACIALWKGVKPGPNVLPQFGFLRKLGLEAIKHHALNLTLQAPSLLLPVLVTVALSTTMNAWFYISWNLSSIGNTIAYSLTLVLYAVSAAQPQTLARKIRLTLCLAFAATVLLNVAFLLGTQQILGFFGHSYAEQAAWSLRILSIETFPFIIKTHYIAVRRVHGRVAPTTLITIATGVLEVGGSALGVHLGGLTGLSLGWFAAMCIEAICMFPTVYRAARATMPALPGIYTELFTEELMGDAREPAWRTDTLIQPVWLADTLTLTAIVLPQQATNAQFGFANDLHLQPTIRLARIPRENIPSSISQNNHHAHIRPAPRLVRLTQDEQGKAVKTHQRE